MAHYGKATPHKLESWSLHDLEATFHQLFMTYSRPLYSFFYNRNFSSEECRDLTQETFLEVFKSLPGFHNRGTVEAWIFSIAQNVWKNRLRRLTAEKRRAQEISLAYLLEENFFDSQSASQEDEKNESAGALGELLSKERIELLREALYRLPPQMRRCVLLRLYQNMKYREIADTLHLSIDTVKSHLFQAKERLRENLTHHFAEL